MVQRTLAVLCLLTVTTTVQSQYFDIFSALQPFLQYSTPRPAYDFTTKRTKSHARTTSVPKIDSQNYFNYDTSYNGNGKQTPSPGAIVFEEDTTVRSRKTTKANRKSDTNQRPKEVHQVANTWNNKPRQDVIPETKPKTDRYDAGRNTVFNYETTKPYVFVTKSPFNDDKRTTKSYTTHNPLIHRPGVRPVVTNGPPITNRPAGRPYERPEDNVTPELIIGPNEDYMSAVEKRRYIELTEKMCEKYKSLNIKQLEAIPLLPSPEPVRVNVSSCAPTTVPLVVGGKVVEIREFPHMALLGWKRLDSDVYSWKCGGSLISNQYVLTAAHCAYQDRDNDVVSGPPSLVQLGSSYLNDRQGRLVKVAAVIRHPKYKLPKSYYDIALVKLMSPVTFSDVIKPACLGPPPEVDESIIATGWGRTEFGGDQSKELRSVSIPVWGYSECREALGTSRRLPEGPSSDSQICAGERRGGKDTCQGDSGGPAQIQDGCIWRVVAITSLGRSCGAPNTPALYAKVPRAFIAAVVFDDKNKNAQSFNTNDRQTYDQTNQNNYQNNQRNSNRNSNNNGYNSSNYQGTSGSNNQDSYNKNVQKTQKNNENIDNNYYNSQDTYQNSHNDYYDQNNPRKTNDNDYYSQNNQRNNNRNSNNNDYHNQNNQRNTDQYYNQEQSSTSFNDQRGNNFNSQRNNYDYTNNYNAQGQTSYDQIGNIVRRNNNYANNDQRNYNYDQVGNNFSNSQRNVDYSSSVNRRSNSDYTTPRYNPQNFYNFGNYNYNPGSWWT